jgi:hypothetical protein
VDYHFVSKEEVGDIHVLIFNFVIHNLFGYDVLYSIFSLILFSYFLLLLLLFLTDNCVVVVVCSSKSSKPRITSLRSRSTTPTATVRRGLSSTG